MKRAWPVDPLVIREFERELIFMFRYRDRRVFGGRMAPDVRESFPNNMHDFFEHMAIDDDVVVDDYSHIDPIKFAEFVRL